jgi:ABC-type sugar transport system permease subunit
MNETAAGPILTTDGIPLKVSLQKSERRNKIRAFLLVVPLLFFILFTFLIPIGDMLLRSVDDSYINTVFPKTFEKYKNGIDKICHPKNFTKQCFLKSKKVQAIV